MKLRMTIAALALSGLGSFASADITGKVNLDGKAPEMKDIDMAAVAECAKQHADPVVEETVVVDEKNNLANVIVSIKKEEGMDLPGETPATAAELDQQGCKYEPHALAMMVGQEFIVKNNDPFLHNVHALSTVNPPFNFGQPNKDEGKKIDPMKAAEYFRVKCDVHPWMSAYIGVFEHPYFAVTKEDGTYSIKTEGLADGEYTINFWHEKYANDDQALPEVKVTVTGGKAEANHTFKAEAALAEPQVKDIVLASTSGEKKDCKACCETSKLQKIEGKK